MIDELEIIKYNGRKIKILDKPNEKLMKAFCLSDMELELKIEQNITKNHNDYIFYDYFFIFIKAGDGSEHLDLIYSKIDLNNKKKVSKPIIKRRIDILDEEEGNKGYREMMNSYKKLLVEFQEISDGTFELY